MVNTETILNKRQAQRLAYQKSQKDDSQVRANYRICHCKTMLFYTLLETNQGVDK